MQSQRTALRPASTTGPAGADSRGDGRRPVVHLGVPGDSWLPGRPTLCGVNAGPEIASSAVAVVQQRRRARYALLLSLVGLVGEAIGTHLVLLSGYCPAGHSCTTSGAVGAGALSVGMLAVIGVGALGNLLLASGLAFLGVGAGCLTAGTQGAGWVGMVVGGEFFATALILLGYGEWRAARRRRTDRDEEALWASGRPARGVILDVDNDGRTAGRRRIITLVMRIDPGGGGERYDVQVDRACEPGESPRPGDVHEVRVDPDDRTHLVVGPKEAG